jgi:hypothetical protein
MPMKIHNFYFGLGLQALSSALAWAFIRFGYSIGWLLVLLISGPLMAAGMIYVLWSDFPLAVRLLCGGWIFGIALWKALSYAIDSNSVKAEVYLIPDSRRGEVNVRFGDPAGEAALEEGGKILLQIAPLGTLSTRYAVKFRRNDLDTKRVKLQEFYFASKDGGRRRIECPEVLDLSKMSDTTLYVFQCGAELGPGDAVARETFVVGTKSAYEQWLAGKR